MENAGECGDAFEAQLCAWTRMQGETVMEVGATVPLASIENAPMDMPMAWPPEDLAVGLPAGSGELQHLTFGWNPMGHGPATYLTPHFDMHFYRIGNDQRTAIDCADESKPATLADAYGMIDEELPDDVAAMIGT